MQKWFYCPCGQKLTKYDISGGICAAVYIKCKRCKNVVEIKIGNADNGEKPARDNSCH